MAIQLQKITWQTLRKALGVSRIRELENGDLVLADTGGNYGPHGKSNVNFILPGSLAPFDEKGNLIDFRQGFQLKSYRPQSPQSSLYKMLKDCNTTGFLLGSDCERQTGKHSIDFRITYSIDHAKYAFIARSYDDRRDHQTDWFSKQCLHYNGGRPLLSSLHCGMACVDYVILPFNRPDKVYGAYAGAYRRAMSELLQLWSEDIGQPEIVGPEGSVTTKPVSVTTGQTPIVVQQPARQIAVDTYRTAMAIVDAVAITPQGFVLSPKIASIAEFDVSYCEFERANTYTWDGVTDDCAVVKYVQTCFTKEPEFLFLHEPAQYTTEQIGYLELLEAKYRHERQEQIQAAYLKDDFCPKCDATWTKQIYQRLRGESDAE